MLKSIKGQTPKVAEKCFIAEGAYLIGEVEMYEGASVWYNCVLRADLAKIIVGKHSNIQDGSVVHVDDDAPVIIGEYVTVGHNATIHGCTIKDRALIGMGATVLNGAIIGEGSIVAAGCVVKEGMVIPANSLVAGVPGKIVKELNPNEQEKRISHAQSYELFWQEYYTD